MRKDCTEEATDQYESRFDGLNYSAAFESSVEAIVRMDYLCGIILTLRLVLSLQKAGVANQLYL